MPSFGWIVPRKVKRKSFGCLSGSGEYPVFKHGERMGMQIKQQLGKLNLKLPLNQLIEEQCVNNGLQILPIETNHIYALNELPLHHKDPFDRLILVQAKLENLLLASADVVFNRYDVDLCW